MMHTIKILLDDKEVASKEIGDYAFMRAVIEVAERVEEADAIKDARLVDKVGGPVAPTKGMFAERSIVLAPMQPADAATREMAQAAHAALKTIGSPSTTKTIIARMQVDHYVFVSKNPSDVLNRCLRQHGFEEVGRGANRQLVWWLPQHTRKP